MTAPDEELPDELPDDARELIEAAQAETAATRATRAETAETRREMAPAWSRATRREDTWGAELEASLTLRGTS